MTCCIHKTLRVTLAMEAGITDHVRFIKEVAELLRREKDALVALRQIARRNRPTSTP